MITVVIAFVAALIAMLLTIWDCDFKWVKIFLWLDGEIGRRPRFKLWCPEMDVWVRIPLKLLIIKGRRIYERTIRTAKRTVCRK